MWLYKLTVAMKPAIVPYWRVRLAGRVESISRRGPLIVAANHTCFLDPWFLAWALPRPVRFLITRNWFDKSALWRWFFRANGTIPVSQSSPRETLLTICERLSMGEGIGIFPEGRISQDGLIRRFRSGVVYVAARSGVPIVPLGIRGAFECLPRSRRLPRPGVVEVHVGAPIAVPGAPTEADLPRRQVVETLDRLLLEVCVLAGQKERFEVLRSSHAARSAEPRLPETL